MAAPAHSDGRRAKRVFKDKVPADDPRDQLAERCIRIRIRASCNGNQRRELRVAQPGKGARNSRKYERNNDRRSGELRRRLSGDDKDSRADNGADPERHQVDRAERAPQAVLSCFARLFHQRFNRLCCQQGVAHATPPLGTLISSLSIGPKAL